MSKLCEWLAAEVSFVAPVRQLLAHLRLHKSCQNTMPPFVSSPATIQPDGERHCMPKQTMRHCFDILMHGLIPLMLAILYPHSRERSREHHQLRWLVRNTVETRDKRAGDGGDGALLIPVIDLDRARIAGRATSPRSPGSVHTHSSRHRDIPPSIRLKQRRMLFPVVPIDSV